MEDIADGKVAMVERVSFDGEIFAGKEDTKMEQFLAMPGDLVISKIRARQGSVGLVSQDSGNVSVTIHYRVLMPDVEKVNEQYAWLVLRSSYARAQFLAATGGAMKGEISEEALLDIRIPLPPFEMQRAIVARWRQAQAEIAAVIAQADEIENQIPDIVYEALGTRPPQPHAETPRYMVLRWSEIDRWSFNYLSRVRQGLLGYTHSQYPIAPLDECLIDTMNGYCIRPVDGPTPYRMLKLNALMPAGLDISATKYVDVAPQIAERFSVRQSDLFICRSVGSYDHVAKCAVARSNAPGILFPDIMIRVRLNSRVLPEYVREVIQTPLGRSFFQSQARTAVGMWKIGAKDIRAFPIPLPPLDVQREIVRRVEESRAEIARLRAQAARRAQEAQVEVEAAILGSEDLPGF